MSTDDGGEDGWGQEWLPPTSPDSALTPGRADRPRSVDHDEWQTVVDAANHVLEENQQLLSRVGGLESAVDQISELLADQPAGGAWAWRYLDPYEQVALFVELRDWVDWVVVRYELKIQIPPCWYEHGPAVEELTALYVSWRATYPTKPRAYSDELIAFHDRWFWPCIDRLGRRKMFGNCTPLRHEPVAEPARTTDPDRFAAFTGALTADPVLPGADAETVHAAIDAKDAIPLRPKDPTTPVKWRGTWWAILANSPDGLWVPRGPHVCESYETLLAQQTQ